MELSEIGLDRWLKSQADELCGHGEPIARVTAVDRDQYIIRNEDGEVPGELTGRFVYTRGESRTYLPCVGDWVCVQYHDSGTHASIHHVLPRKSFLRRKSPGKNIEFRTADQFPSGT